MNKTVLIAGASGQDGFYLSQKLNNKGYKVIGLSRKNRKLEFCDKVIKTNYNKSSLVKIIKKFKPKIIFNFAGETSPKVSWRVPFSTINSIIRINQNFLNSILLTNKKIKYFNASSAEIFGNSKKKLSENSKYYPLNPYGCFKLCAHQNLIIYRKKFKLFLVNGILFNHESKRRPNRFLSSKIIRGGKEILKKKKRKLILNNPNPIRDFAHAEDIVDGIFKIMNLKKPDDYVISGGNILSVKNFAEKIFNKLGIDKRKIIFENKITKSYLDKKVGNSIKIRKKTKWKAKYTGKKFIDSLLV